MSDIDQTVERARRGDRKAVAALYETYAPVIYRYVAYRVANADDIEDITAEVFVQMVRGLPRYKPTGVPFEAWLYRIAAARIIDFRRRARRRPESDLSDTLADTSPLPEDRAQQHQQFAALRSAMQQLSDEQQTILILRFVERKSHEEVAHILGKSMTAVKTAQYRALMQLVDLLGSEAKARHYLRGHRD